VAAPPNAAHLAHCRLPLVTLYLTERCNSRCITCDYWRRGRIDMNLESVRRLLPALHQLGTRLVVLSGGEPLLHPEWAAIAQLLKSQGLDVWLLTSGLSLAKHARLASELFQSVTVSLDGTDRETYVAIRGLDAFEKVCEGIQAAAAHGLPPSLRVTLQRRNYRQLPAFVHLAKSLGACQVSFLAVDIASPHAFGRLDNYAGDLALLPRDLPILDQLLQALEREHEDEFRAGFIAESPQKLRRILQYFAAILGREPYPSVRCNAPEFSAVIGASGRVQPCFFIPGPPNAQVFGVGAPFDGDLASLLLSDRMVELRATIRSGSRAECKTCVCSMWRDPDTFLRDPRSMRSTSGATA
jgi:MoaA/NifB/PqqE/SkfB family radical SAM enzyme